MSMSKPTWLIASGLTTIALVTTACGPEPQMMSAQSYETVATSPQSETALSGGIAPEPVLDEAQIRRIVEGVQEVLDRATETGDPAVLEERLIGSALSMRTAEFTRASKTGSEVPPLVIEVNVASATVAQSFPRTLLVGSAASADQPAEVFLFVQEEAQADYMLENWARVVGGNSIHGVAIDDGSKTLGPESEGFILTPTEAVEKYAGFLKDPDNADFQIFADDTYAPAMRKEIDDLRAAVSEVGGIGFDAVAGDFPIIGVELASGEGLFAASLRTSVTYDRTVAQSTMTIAGTAASYVDNPNVVGTVTANYLVNFFFVLPPEGSEEKIKIVGVERSIQDVTRNDDAKPEGE